MKAKTVPVIVSIAALSVLSISNPTALGVGEANAAARCQNTRVVNVCIDYVGGRFQGRFYNPASGYTRIHATVTDQRNWAYPDDFNIAGHITQFIYTDPKPNGHACAAAYVAAAALPVASVCTD